MTSLTFPGIRWGVSLGLMFALCCSVSAQDRTTTIPQQTPPASTHGLIDDTVKNEEVVQERQVQGKKSEAVPNPLHKKLERYLTGAKFIGKFTVTGMEEKAPSAEEYHILAATKASEGDYWMLKVRIQYGGKDVTVPLPPMEIKWAGETPVITVDQLTIPGMGTFDARVLIRKNKYSGTWAHNEVGGHLFGRIVTAKAAAEEAKKKAEKPNSGQSDQ